MSFDNTHLFTCSQDGTLYLFEIKDKDPNRPKRDKDGLNQVIISDEILTQKSDLDELQ